MTWSEVKFTYSINNGLGFFTPFLDGCVTFLNILQFWFLSQTFPLYGPFSVSAEYDVWAVVEHLKDLTSQAKNILLPFLLLLDLDILLTSEYTYVEGSSLEIFPGRKKSLEVHNRVNL